MTTSIPAATAASQSDRGLLLAARHRDPIAETELLRRFEPLVRATLRQMTVPAGSDRDDLAQEARIGLLSAIRTWRPEHGAFPALAKRCILNRLIMTLNYAGRHKQRVLDHALSLDAPLGNPGPHKQRVLGPAPALDTLLEPLTLHARLASTAADPERCALVNAQLRAVIEDIPALTDREQRALRGALNGRSQHDLALEQNTTPKAVHLGYARARRKLGRNPIFAAA